MRRALHVAILVGLAFQPAWAQNPWDELPEVDRRYYQAWGLSPDDPDAHLEYAAGLLSQREWSSAEEHLELALRKPAADPDQHTERGELLARIGRPEAARSELELVVGTGAASEARAHSILGRVEGRLGDPEAALAHFQRAVQLDPENAWPRFNLAVSLDHHDRAPEAIEHLEMALELAPDFQRARRQIAKLLSRQGRFDEAARHYLLLLERDPDDPVALRDLARAQEALGNAELARSNYERSLAIARGDRRHRWLLKELREKLGDPEPSGSQPTGEAKRR